MTGSRKIQFAYSEDTNSHVNVNSVVDTYINAFNERKKTQLNKVHYTCIECGQKLNFATSKNDILHFKHLPKSDECILKYSNSSEVESFNKYWKSKESPRHIELKNLIGNKLKNHSHFNSVSIDDKFIIRDGQKRRPDVYCKYLDKEIVFEIQLSDLSLSYIVGRHEFYKKYSIYLIWILDDFDPDKRSQLVRDIKYLNQYQNFFKLNENDHNFSLTCKYKKCWIEKSELEVHSKWQSKNLAIEELKFDMSHFQVFYSDFSNLEKNLISKTNQLKENQRIKEANRIAEAQVVAASKIVSDTIFEIKIYLAENGTYFDNYLDKISFFNELEIKILNESLNLNSTEVFVRLMNKYNNHQFVLFLLKCKQINIGINGLYQEKSTFQHLMDNQKIIYKSLILKEMLKRGYSLIDNDFELDKIDKEWRETLVVAEKSRYLHTDALIDKLFEEKTMKLILIVESIRTKEFKCYNYSENDWLGFANNLLHNYNDHWSYLESCFKRYGLWSDLVQKESFRNKVELLQIDMPRQKTEFLELFGLIYPEIKPV